MSLLQGKRLPRRPMTITACQHCFLACESCRGHQHPARAQAAAWQGDDSDAERDRARARVAARRSRPRHLPTGTHHNLGTPSSTPNRANAPSTFGAGLTSDKVLIAWLSLCRAVEWHRPRPGTPKIWHALHVHLVRGAQRTGVYAAREEVLKNGRYARRVHVSWCDSARSVSCDTQRKK